MDSQSATVRSLLSKMAENGQLEKLRRGLYRLGSVTMHGPGPMLWLQGHQASAARVQGHYRLDEPVPAERARRVDSQPSMLDEENEPTDADYSEMNRDAGQAHRENQAPVPGPKVGTGSGVHPDPVHGRDSDVSEYADRSRRSDHESSDTTEANRAKKAEMESGP